MYSLDTAEQKQGDQLCEDTGCSPEDLPEAMNDREMWQERIRDIHADGTTRLEIIIIIIIIVVVVVVVVVDDTGIINYYI